MKFALVGVSGTQDAWGSREEKEAPSGCPGAIGSPGRALDGLFGRLVVSVMENGIEQLCLIFITSTSVVQTTAFVRG
jgi:hypothetical protein